MEREGEDGGGREEEGGMIYLLRMRVWVEKSLGRVG